MHKRFVSLYASILCIKVLYPTLLALLFLFPFLINWYTSLEHSFRQFFWPILIIAYLCLIPSGIAVFCMDRLLANIRRQVVFDKKNADRLYLISWCAFALCLLFFFAGLMRPLAFVVAAAAFFLGMVLRVVEHIFRQAIAIREENDFTI